MGVNFQIFYRIIFGFVLILQIFTRVEAQASVGVTVGVREGSTKVSVLGKGPGRSTLSFVKSDLGFKDLASRVSDISLEDAAGRAVGFTEPIRGEIVADGEFVEWSYLIDLSPKDDQRAAAHISWLTGENGLLMLGDMLPMFSVEGKPIAANVNISLPSGWRAYKDRFETSDLGLEVIAVGRDIEFRKVSADVPLTVATYCTRDACGPVGIGSVGKNWLFSNEELDGFSAETYKGARDVFGGDAHKDVVVNLFRFPHDPKTNPGSWQAETRGNNISIISSDMAFRTQSVQRLHEQLRHEMLHLWIPNSVELTGNYDWFYEGFILYQALKIGVATNRISFSNYLDTLSRAKAIEARYEKRGSLIAASKERWIGAETYIYAKGMLVAFLCDTAMLDASNGKRSVETVLSGVYAKHRKGSIPTDGNAAVLELLKQNRELIPIVERFITGGNEFSWDGYIDKAGLEVDNGLKAKQKPVGRQKRILDALGYNNWRNIRR